MSEEQVRILVVDDEEAVRNLLQRILEEAGYQVITVADGQEALYQASLQETGIMLLDLKMQGISGMEVLRKLATDSPDYCVIMVTAVADMQTAVEAMKMGAYDYITKPFDRDDVVQKVRDAIDRWMRRSKEQRQHLELREKFLERTKLMQEQFEELVSSLSREHKLMLELAAKEADGGESMLSKLPPELREPMSSVEEFRDALLKILRRS